MLGSLFWGVGSGGYDAELTGSPHGQGEEREMDWGKDKRDKSKRAWYGVLRYLQKGRVLRGQVKGS